MLSVKSILIHVAPVAQIKFGASAALGVHVVVRPCLRPGLRATPMPLTQPKSLHFLTIPAHTIGERIDPDATVARTGIMWRYRPHTHRDWKDPVIRSGLSESF